MGLKEERIKRLVKWARGGKAGPVSIELVPTERCNLNCLSCWRRSWTKEDLERRFSQEMSDERLLQLIDEGKEIGLREVAFVGGGEPLLRDVTFKLMKKIKDYGMEGDLVTNGTLFDAKMIQEIVEMGWDRIKFSVDGVDAKTHDFLRGREGAFEEVMNNIKKFAEVKRKLGSEKPRLLFNTVISKRNYRQLPKLVKLGKRIGLNGILLLPLTAFCESMKGMKLGEKEVKEFMGILKESIELAREFGMENNFHYFLDPKYIQKTESMDEVMMEEVERKIEQEYPSFEDPVENFKHAPCYMPWHHITILANGNIAPCFGEFVWKTDVSIKDHSLKELWFGEYFESYRRIMLERRLPDGCKTCCVWRVFENREIREGLERLLR